MKKIIIAFFTIAALLPFTGCAEIKPLTEDERTLMKSIAKELLDINNACNQQHCRVILILKDDTHVISEAGFSFYTHRGEVAALPDNEKMMSFMFVRRPGDSTPAGYHIKNVFSLREVERVIHQSDTEAWYRASGAFTLQ